MPKKKTEQVSESATSLKMMSDRILVIPSNEDGERSTRGGLLIPATANDDRRLRWGDVLSVGPHTRLVETGDRVLYAPDTGYEVEISGSEYLILRERDIHAVADKEGSKSTGLYL